MRSDAGTIRRLLQADRSPSDFVETCLSQCQAPAGGVALDIPCGAGRHLAPLQRRGYSVFGADLSSALLHEALRRSEQGFTGTPSANFIQLDANREFPFPTGSFDLVLVVHFFIPGLVGRLCPLVKPGGFLILETFGAQGGNGRRLPLQGEVRDGLTGDWTVIEERERRVKSAYERRAVRLFARSTRTI